MSEKIYTFEEYDAGEVPDTGDEVFDPVRVEVAIGEDNFGPVVMRKLAYYEGRRSGIRLGPWFAEIMEIMEGRRDE